VSRKQNLVGAFETREKLTGSQSGCSLTFFLFHPRDTERIDGERTPKRGAEKKQPSPRPLQRARTRDHRRALYALIHMHFHIISTTHLLCMAPLPRLRSLSALHKSGMALERRLERCCPLCRRPKEDSKWNAGRFSGSTICSRELGDSVLLDLFFAGIHQRRRKG